MWWCLGSNFRSQVLSFVGIFIFFILPKPAASALSPLAAGCAVNQIAEKERDRKGMGQLKAEPVNTKAPTLEEKVRFTYDLYRTNKIDVSLLYKVVLPILRDMPSRFDVLMFRCLVSWC